MNQEVLFTDQQITNQDELITEQQELEIANGLIQMQTEREEKNQEGDNQTLNNIEDLQENEDKGAQNQENKQNFQNSHYKKINSFFIRNQQTTFLDANLNENEQSRFSKSVLQDYNEEIKPEKESSFLIQPFSNFKYYFLLIESFLILYNIFLVPFRYAFSLIRQKNLMIIDICMDSFFLCTIIVKFFCAYVDKTRVVKDFKSIAFRYCFGFLWMDSNGLFIFEVFALFPYYIFDTWYGTRFLRMLQIGSVLDYFQVLCNKILGFFTSNINLTKSLTTILQFLLLLCIIAQYLSCFWYYLGIKKEIEYGYDKNEKQFRLMSGWVYEQLFVGEEDPTHQVGKNLQTEFIASLYWVFTTLTTLGYGDFYGQTSYERIFTMFVQFIGVFIFAYMMGNINNLIEKLNDDHLEYIQNENENLDQWIIKIDRANPTKKLPKQFVDDLRKRFTIYWQRDHSTVVQEFPFFNQLPVNLRSELVDHMFRGFIDRFSVFFKDLEKQFTNAVVVNLYPKKYTQDNDTSDQRKQIDIIPIDTCPNDLFFITKGHVTIASKDGVHMYITLGPGSYFGDHLILFNLKSSNAFIAIDEDLECMCIDRKIFLDLCDFYPNSHKILKDKAYQRRKKFRETKEEVMLNEKMQTLRQKTSGNQFQANLNGTNLLQQNSNKNSNVNQLSFNQAIVERLMSPDINSNAQSPALQQRQTTSSNKIKKINSEYYYEGEENQNKKEQEINSSESSENNNETDRNQTNQIQKTETNIQQAEEKELKNKRLQKELDQVKQLQDQFNKSIKDNLQNLGSQIQNDQIEGSDNDDLQNFKIHEEEMKQNEILKLAKDLNDKIEILKKSICLLDSEIKTKISNIKTELEFVTSYEEVLHDFDENEITELNKN